MVGLSGLVFEAHRLWYHTTLATRVKKREKDCRGGVPCPALRGSTSTLVNKQIDSKHANRA